MMRRVVAAIAVALIMSTAGCGFVMGNQPLNVSSSKVNVSQSAQSSAGYEETNVTALNWNRSFSIANQTRTVHVKNWLAQYERQVTLPGVGSQRAAVFAAFSTPAVKILDRTFNPIGDMSHKEIVEKFASQYEGVQVDEKVDTRQVEALGAKRNVSRFSGQAQLAGSTVDVYINVARFEHDGDYIAVIAVYPQRLQGERDNVDTLIEGLQHHSG